VGIVVDSLKAFRVCHGYKIDHELILWSPGVVGTLSDDQELKCRKIIIENAKGNKVFYSVADALEAETSETPKLGQMSAIRTCAQLLDLAEDAKIITGRKDVYAFMDYCMSKLGYDGVQRDVPDYIKKFVDKMLKEEGVKNKF